MIILIRHGQSQANAKGVTQGSKSDTGLTKQGHDEARRTAEFLVKRGIKVNRIYSSPIQRAVETAEHIAAAFKKPIIRDDLLIETDKGDLSGLTQAEISAAYAKTQLSRKAKQFDKMDMIDLALNMDELIEFDEIQIPLFKIESYKAICRRIRTFLDKIPAGVTIVVTHTGLIGSFMAYMFNQYTMKSCNLSEKTSNCHISIVHKCPHYVLALDRYNKFLD